MKVINAGISGHTTTEGLARLDRDVLQHKPDLVTVSFGLNDMIRVPEEQFVGEPPDARRAVPRGQSASCVVHAECRDHARAAGLSRR